ncbi:MAG: ligand-binding sensor domain-containing protein, partial [Bryobacteraceae bacterium]
MGLCLGCASLRAQRENFKLYTEDSGLGNLSVNCLLQDRTGFIWIGTQNGLYRYDGKSFQRFGADQGLQGSEVEALAETPDGTLWAASRDGIARLWGNRFVPIPLPDAAEIIGSSTLASDGASRVYVATTKGLFRVDRRDGQYRVQRLTERVTRSALVDASGAVWFGCRSSLCRIPPGSAKVETPFHLPPDRWESLLEDRRGSLWIRSATRLLERPRGASDFTARD